MENKERVLMQKHEIERLLAREYVQGGELFKAAKGKLKEDAARKYFQQLISAVASATKENLKVSDQNLGGKLSCFIQPAYVAAEVITEEAMMELKLISGHGGDLICSTYWLLPNEPCLIDLALSWLPIPTFGRNAGRSRRHDIL
uniref:Uncharacterized protein n=1 Tax=Salix viminalis TaxID=40686 RepID=A0A6N2KLU1_SALVM